MAAILVTSIDARTLESVGRWVAVDMTSGKHSVCVIVKPESDFERVRVMVQNSSHKVWRGMGRGFKTEADAVAAYKTGEIRSMIAHAVAISGAAFTVEGALQ